MSDYALVTGGARGIGAAIAHRLQADGLKVLVADLDLPEHEAAEDAVAVDLADMAAARHALDRLIAGRPVTRLVNNAGIVLPATVEDTDPATLNDVAAVNLRAPILCLQAVLGSMKAARMGRVINISSRAALGKASRTVYAATKAGLHGMTKTWALELGPHGITVNAVGPGPIATELFNAANPPGDPRTEKMLATIPVGRIGTVDDVANAVSFFCAASAGFVTGQVLYVCGGMTIGSA